MLRIELLQRNCSVLWVTRLCFLKSGKNVWSSVRCASSLTSLPHQPRAGRDQAIWRREYTLKCSRLLSTGAQGLMDHSVRSWTKIWPTIDIWISNKWPQGQSWEVNKCSLTRRRYVVKHNLVVFDYIPSPSFTHTTEMTHFLNFRSVQPSTILAGYFCTLIYTFCMGVKLGRPHWGRNVGWWCLRIGCWGEYLGLKGTR